MTKRQKIAAASAGVVFVLFLLVWITCIPPYNTPMFEDISNNETGFLVPLDNGLPVGDTQPVQFESASYLAQRKVASKRVQITRRWVQQGYMPSRGEYIPTVRLIKVNRATVRREWTQDPQSGTSPSDDAITVQSKNGTVIRVAFTCTAYIPESDAEKGDKAENPEGAEHFLYFYKGDNLEHVMDEEVRARVQAVAAEYCSKMPDDTLRGSQHDLVVAVEQDVVPFFKRRGIAITKIGLAGGFHYVNPDIQRGIDNAIAAQQLKVAALANQEKEKVENETRLQNQKIENDRLVLQADGRAKAKASELEGEAKAKQAAARVDAETAKIEAEGRAQAVKIEADAEAYKLGKIDQYRELVLSLKSLEVEKSWRSLWQGGVPGTVIGPGGSAMPFLPLQPTPNPVPPPKK
jgi:hypothetical protein